MVIFVNLQDTGHDYPDGTEFDAQQGIEPETIQRAGFWGVVGNLWQVAVCVAVLAVLAYQAIKPRAEGQRREARPREPSLRQKVANWPGYAVVVAIPVGILSWIAMIAEPTPLENLATKTLRAFDITTGVGLEAADERREGAGRERDRALRRGLGVAYRDSRLEVDYLDAVVAVTAA